MNQVTCAEMQLLIQADADGELTPAEAARMGEHLDACPNCAALPAQLANLSSRLRQEVPYHPAPDSLRAGIQARIAAAAAKPTPGRAPMWAAVRSWLRAKTAVPFGAGFAVAACLVLLLAMPRDRTLPDELVADHIRALQPGHLMDVASTDQHTVKPWFDGRLDFAPPVKDLKGDGFPLTGGRLDYVAGRQAAVLIYQRRQHIINLFIWPETGHPTPLTTSRSGYNIVRWSQGGMTFWAISDLDPKELAEFAGDFQRS